AARAILRLEQVVQVARVSHPTGELGELREPPGGRSSSVLRRGGGHGGDGAGGRTADVAELVGLGDLADREGVDHPAGDAALHHDVAVALWIRVRLGAV